MSFDQCMRCVWGNPVISYHLWSPRKRQLLSAHSSVLCKIRYAIFFHMHCVPSCVCTHTLLTFFVGRVEMKCVLFHFFMAEKSFPCFSTLNIIRSWVYNSEGSRLNLWAVLRQTELWMEELRMENLMFSIWLLKKLAMCLRGQLISVKSTFYCNCLERVKECLAFWNIDV